MTFEETLLPPCGSTSRLNNENSSARFLFSLTFANAKLAKGTA